jgi:hypothetical protein
VKLIIKQLFPLHLNLACFSNQGDNEPLRDKNNKWYWITLLFLPMKWRRFLVTDEAGSDHWTESQGQSLL